jgi:isoquinoline 1-oxidoreductase subunit beta
MNPTKSGYSRRAFLKSSLMAGGGLMISFTVIPELAAAEKTAA